MSYVLIVLMYSYYGYTTVAMQEFGSQDACMFAANQIASADAKHKKIICVPKGIKGDA